MTNKPLPEYICTKCAEKQPGYNPNNFGYTLHQNICPLCKKEGMLATLRDFGIKPTNTKNWD